MLISPTMKLDELAAIAVPRVQQNNLQAIRARLVLAWDGQDTDSLTQSDWQKVLDFEDVAPVQIMSGGDKLFYLHFNRKTSQVFSEGMREPERLGDRSIDSSWICFEVWAPDISSARRLMDAYLTHPEAKLTDKEVQIVNNIAINGDRRVQLILEDAPESETDGIKP